MPEEAPVTSATLPLHLFIPSSTASVSVATEGVMPEARTRRCGGSEPVANDDSVAADASATAGKLAYEDSCLAS
jgi:hypothetical protein